MSQRRPTWSPAEQVASSACQMACFAPLLTTTSCGPYRSPFSASSLSQIARRSAAVPVLGV